MNRSPIHKRVLSLFLSISLDTLGVRAVTITDDSSNLGNGNNTIFLDLDSGSVVFATCLGYNAYTFDPLDSGEMHYLLKYIL